VQEAAFGLGGECGEFLEELADLEAGLLAENALKELCDFVIYIFLYHQLACPKEFFLFEKSEALTYLVDSWKRQIALPKNEVILAIFRINEFEKKRLRGMRPPVATISGLLQQILGYCCLTAYRLKLDLDGNLRKVIIENYQRAANGDFGCKT
jgi:hypothetical protein